MIAEGSFVNTASKNCTDRRGTLNISNLVTVTAPKDDTRYSDEVKSNCFSNEMLAEVVQPKVGMKVTALYDVKRGMASLLNSELKDGIKLQEKGMSIDLKYPVNFNTLQISPKMAPKSTVAVPYQNEVHRMNDLKK